MEELLRTNDPVVISALTSLFEEEEIPHFVADQHMSVLEGSIGILQRRIMVASDYINKAKRLTRESGFGEWLEPEKG